MRWVAMCLMLAGCGGSAAAPDVAADAAPEEQPTIFCQSMGEACSSGWKSGGITKCSGRLNEDAGGCDLVPGAGGDAGWWYCCPGGE